MIVSFLLSPSTPVPSSGPDSPCPRDRSLLLGFAPLTGFSSRSSRQRLNSRGVSLRIQRIRGSSEEGESVSYDRFRISESWAQASIFCNCARALLAYRLVMLILQTLLMRPNALADRINSQGRKRGSKGSEGSSSSGSVDFLIRMVTFV